jgi:hypothetical protein
MNRSYCRSLSGEAAKGRNRELVADVSEREDWPGSVSFGRTRSVTLC